MNTVGKSLVSFVFVLKLSLIVVVVNVVVLPFRHRSMRKLSDAKLLFKKR